MRWPAYGNNATAFTLLPVASVAATAADTKPVYSDAAALGKLIFFDATLSASGKMSCASCHSPSHAYGPPNGLAAATC